MSMMNNDDGLDAHREGDVCHARLNRPHRGNALSAGLVQAITQLVAECAEIGVRQLVLTGTGRHFCTGVDLSDLETETDDTLLARFVRIELMLQALHQAPFDTVAVAHGRVAGAGADLFAACRQRLIAGEAWFSFPGASGFGLVLGSRRLAGTVGAATAQGWISDGRWIDTGTALASGLATALGETPASSAAGLDAATTVALRQAIHGNLADDSDLALLARSAARPGLKQRIASYAARLRAHKPSNTP